ncbi:MAG: YsnF/AvaK domain-containing protein [Acidobacteriota bacterium]|nr:YsnF/AvaK domain-containing protein [Acidobacteriota bacterium]
MAQTQNESTSTIVGYFEDSSKATQAVEALRDAGFTSAHIGMAHRESSAAGSSAGSTASSSVAHAGAKVGEKAEGAWDTIKSFFTGNEAEPYADERSRGDLATREITSDPDDMSTRSSGQYQSSDLHGSLSGMSVPEDRSRYFGHRFDNNQEGAVVTVNAGGRSSEAESILTRFGADLGDNAADYDYNQTRNFAENTETAGAQNNIQLLGEVLRVHKDRISRGEVRIHKEVITENQTIQVPVTREELVIERRAVNENTPATGTIGESQDIRIPLTEERASIDKSTFVREEVAIGKKPVEEVRNLESDVRHEELVVDDTTSKRTA